jgi:atypical dual specificity phosphatase
MSDIILSLRKFGVAIGERVILSSVDLDVHTPGITILVGPSGTGKSTLIRTLSGINSAIPSMRMWGNAIYAGQNIGEIEYPSLVAQNTKLMLSSVMENLVSELPERNNLTIKQQRDVVTRMLHTANLGDLSENLEKNVVDLPLAVQRHLAIVRTVAPNPRMVFIDEPTTNLKDEDSAILLEYIKQEAERRAIMVILHHQGHAKQLGGRTALIAGGWIHETQPTEEFFSRPKTEIAKTFVYTGSCCAPSPDTPVEHVDTSAIQSIESPPPLPENARKYVSDAFGPRNFLWLIKGVLAGTPRPGLLIDLEDDLESLKRVGVTVLVSLTTKPVDPAELDKFGILGVALPIKDMGAPSIDDAKTLCSRVEALISSGEVVAMHCKAGLGRTGTMLAAQLIWQGHTALESLERVRKIEPRWVQSEEQVDFLKSFFEDVKYQRRLVG